MARDEIVFGSRKSALAMTQTKAFADEMSVASGVTYRVESMTTTGDRITDRPLSGIGIKGLFTRELEDALRDASIDAAIHSLKDLPVEDPEGITLGAVSRRANPFDLLVCRPDALLDIADLADDAARSAASELVARLRDGSRVGTSSPRRAAALRLAKHSLEIRDIRGNVPTRVQKLRDGEYEAIVLAAAGVERLGLELDGLITEELRPEFFTPAPAQGALGVQCRVGDARVVEILRPVHDTTTALCVNAERQLLFGLGGGCSMPLGVLVTPCAGSVGAPRFRVLAALFDVDGHRADDDGGADDRVEGRVRALRAAVITDDPSGAVDAIVAAWKPLLETPLSSMRIAMPRPDGAQDGLSAALAVAGAELHVPAWTRIEAREPSRDTLASAASCDALAFTSSRAVRHFAEQLRAAGLDMSRTPCFAVGARTATELVLHGFENVVSAASREGAELAASIASDGRGLQRFVYPCARERHPAFEAAMREAGLRVEALEVYGLTSDEGEADAALPDSLDAIVVTSPSSARDFARRGASLASTTRIVAVGASTEAALREHASAVLGDRDIEVLPRVDAVELVAALRAGAVRHA